MTNDESTMLEAAELLTQTADKLREWWELPAAHRSGTALQLAGLVPLAAQAIREVATVLDGADDVEREPASPRYTLHVTWADGREERIPVRELGAVVRVGPNDGREPQRIPVYHRDGETIAIVETWADEIPTIVAVRS